MTLDDVLDRLRSEISAKGSATAWAAQAGCSPSYVSDVLAKKREPGPLILQQLGLESITVYRAAGG